MAIDYGQTMEGVLAQNMKEETADMDRRRKAQDDLLNARAQTAHLAFQQAVAGFQAQQNIMNMFLGKLAKDFLEPDYTEAVSGAALGFDAAASRQQSAKNAQTTPPVSSPDPVTGD